MNVGVMSYPSAHAVTDVIDDAGCRPGTSEVLRLVDAADRFGRDRVRAMLSARRWQRPHRRVVVLHNGPLTPAQQIWVALLSAPDGAALCGPTAASLDGLSGFPDPLLHVVVGPHDRLPLAAGTRYHRTAHLGPEDVHPARRPRRTRIARSVVDTASWTSVEGRARLAIIAAVQQRLVKPSALGEALTRRGPCRWHAVIVESIADAEGGIQSLPERNFQRIVASRGFPVPTRQSVRRRADGKYYLDAEWTAYGVTAEIHGTPHLEVAQWDADLDRGSELAAGAGRLLQFSSYGVRRRPDRVGDLVALALGNAGWRGRTA